MLISKKNKIKGNKLKITEHELESFRLTIVLLIGKTSNMNDNYQFILGWGVGEWVSI